VGFSVGQGRDAYLLGTNVYVQDGNLVLRSLANDQGYNYTSGTLMPVALHLFVSRT
jgi:hypothetical protein